MPQSHHRLDERQYSEALRRLHDAASARAASMTETAAQQLEEAEYELLIDFKLGTDLAAIKRAALLRIYRKMRRAQNEIVGRLIDENRS